MTTQDGNITSVAYSSQGTIGIGTMMNVTNPNPFLQITHPLGNTGVVVVEGDPAGGWRMVSWNGIPTPPANLPTALLVDVRNLITAPQYAAWDIGYSLLSGDPTTILTAVRDGIEQVGKATINFPIEVIEDIAKAVDGGLPALVG